MYSQSFINSKYIWGKKSLFSYRKLLVTEIFITTLDFASVTFGLLSAIGTRCLPLTAFIPDQRNLHALLGIMCRIEQSFYYREMTACHVMFSMAGSNQKYFQLHFSDDCLIKNRKMHEQQGYSLQNQWSGWAKTLSPQFMITMIQQLHQLIFYLGKVYIFEDALHNFPCREEELVNLRQNRCQL